MTARSRSWRARGWPAVAAVVVAIAGSGCQTQLMPTPNIYLDGRFDPFEGVPEAEKTNKVDLLYVTDRAPITQKDGSIRYGYGRSPSLAFGSCVVEIGRDVDWDTLVACSTSRKRSRSLPMRVIEINETGRLAPTPLPLVRLNGELVDNPQKLAAQRELGMQFVAEVQRRLAFTPRKVVFVFVHGFNNTFDYAAEVLAEFYHFGGRAGVPILYTWPAGSPGLLKGYNHDRESGEFTIFHLKQLIRALAQVPELEKIHIIAHSRGTDVAASALRELLIEERGGGRDPRKTMKLSHVVLASPDMDLDVVRQRFGAERFFNVCEHLTMYVSSKDKALGLSEWLFQSRQRLGQVRPEDFTPEQIQQGKLVGWMDIVDASVKTGFLGHSYYHSNPAVSSDLLLTLRYGAEAGSPQRPLREVAPNYWVLDDEDYPFGEKQGPIMGPEK